MPDWLVSQIRVTRHAARDDLLSAGLGLDRLRAPTPPAFADAQAPTPDEVRRRAIWNNWRGIADLAPGGGFGDVYGCVPMVPGREYQAFAKLPGASQPHRVLTQIPDTFDRKTRGVVVAASSGSRGIYGAIALAGAWGLTHGCAVAYTDKGAGTGYFDIDTASGVRLDGTRGSADAALEFAPAIAVAPAHAVAVKHAHSTDNPEADWGRHVLQAAQFALLALNDAFPADAPFTFANTRVIACGISNGAGAALRAAELDPDRALAGIVAVAPNVWPEAGEHPLFDYATQAAIYHPCALLDARFDAVALARPQGEKPPAWIARCAQLRERGLLTANRIDTQAREAYERLRAGGWTDAALAAGASSVSFDLWRALAVTYASAYMRAGPATMPCGYRFAALDRAGTPRASTAAERAAWAPDGSGIPPSPAIGMVDTPSSGPDPTLAGLLRLRALWDAGDEAARRLQAGVTETRAGHPRSDLPIVVVHGADDGLVPEAFSGGAYIRCLQQRGGERNLRYWRVTNAQHFDAFLGLPVFAARYLPLLPYAYAAMDAVWANVINAAALPPSAQIATTPRAMAGAIAHPLTIGNIGTIPY